MTTPSPRRLVAATVLAGAALGLATTSAQAATVPLGSGATTLTLDKGAAKALTSLGVGVAPVSPAKAGSAGIAFPITGGDIDPATAAGTITHSGGLRLKAGATKLALTDFTVHVGAQPTISVKVNGGARLSAFRLVLGKAKVTRVGIGTKASNIAVHLSTAGARALNATFKVKAFKPKLKLGTVVVKAQPAQAVFTGGHTALTLDPGAASALQSLGVTPGIADGALARADGALAFPFTEGSVNAKTLAGTIQHKGAITLTKGATVVTLSDFLIDTTAKTLSAKVNGSAPVAILSLDLSDPQVAVARQAVTVGGVGAALTQGAADALNQAFGTTAFTAGLKLGTAVVRGRTA